MGIDQKDDDPLFDKGLRLDSPDSVERELFVEKHFSVEIKDMNQNRATFRSINSLTAFSKKHLAK